MTDNTGVEVVDYQQSWPTRFEQLKTSYARALDAASLSYRIEHVGSTSVPGLAAKPVIDVDIVVTQADVEAATKALTGIGFVARGDLGVADRYAFVTPETFAPSHTYLVIEGSLAFRNHLAVREVLRSDPDLRSAYQEVKRNAAASSSNIDDYLLAKSEVLGRILQRAGLTEAERRSISQTNRHIAERGAEG